MEEEGVELMEWSLLGSGLQRSIVFTVYTHISYAKIEKAYNHSAMIVVSCGTTKQ